MYFCKPLTGLKLKLAIDYTKNCQFNAMKHSILHKTQINILMKQYLLSYYSSNRRQGNFHVLNKLLKRYKLKLYFAAFVAFVNV